MAKISKIFSTSQSGILEFICNNIDNKLSSRKARNVRCNLILSLKRDKFKVYIVISMRVLVRSLFVSDLIYDWDHCHTIYIQIAMVVESILTL